jgi:hypothetical protein
MRTCTNCGREHGRKQAVCSRCYHLGYRANGSGTVDLDKAGNETWELNGDQSLASPERLYITPSGGAYKLREMVGDRLGWQRA